MLKKTAPYNGKTQANHTQFPSPALQKTTVESPANYPVIMENHGFPFWGNQRRSIGAVFSLPILFTRFRCITPCGFTETRNSNLSGISLTRCLILLPRIYGQRVVFKLNFKSPSPHHMERKLFANTYTVRNSNSSGSTKTRKKQLILAGNPKFASLLEEYKEKLKFSQHTFHDPWVMKWSYE